MPLGFERLNERASRPNALINFIKPLPGAGAATAERILNRVAARCYPIMKANGIAVMALEEYEPNPEFVGRNFNAGEVIQLVLKSRNGRWLSIKQVEMVMMHELAHCKQMNHSKFFWKLRDAYAEELKGLWAKGYIGEGLWGRGRELEGGAVVNEDESVDIIDVESLCGGTYKSRGTKRKSKAKPQLSYAERQQRRILRKFGADGTALGADEAAKSELEDGRTTKGKGKPRVAKSARGRELRAAAALARVDKVKDEQEQEIVKREEVDVSGTESEDEYDEVGGPAALDVNGRELRDGKGNGLVKISEDEDQDDVHVKQEINEFRELRQEKITRFTRKQPPTDENALEIIDLSKDSPSHASSGKKSTKTKAPDTQHSTIFGTGYQSTGRGNSSKPSNPRASSNNKRNTASAQPSANTACPVCSLVNESAALTCTACANVLKPKAVAGSWKCKSLTCRGGVYMNSRGSARCGVCGAAKEVQ